MWWANTWLRTKGDSKYMIKGPKVIAKVVFSYVYIYIYIYRNKGTPVPQWYIYGHIYDRTEGRRSSIDDQKHVLASSFIYVHVYMHICPYAWSNDSSNWCISVVRETYNWSTARQTSIGMHIYTDHWKIQVFMPMRCHGSFNTHINIYTHEIRRGWSKYVYTCIGILGEQKLQQNLGMY